MAMSLKAIIYLMTASVSLLSVAGNKVTSCVNTPVTETALPGGSVTISCNYPEAESNILKYFCRIEENSECTNVISTYQSNYTKRDRFSMTDSQQQRFFTVTISLLTQNDAGRYCCAFARVSNDTIDCSTKICLSISSGTIGTPAPSPPSVQKGKDNIGIIIRLIGYSVVILVVILVVVFCRFRQKLLRAQEYCAAWRSSVQGTNAGHNTEGNHGDHDYEDIQMENQKPSSGETLPSVYVTLSLPADQLNYASINFHKDSVSVSTDGNALPDTNKYGSLACDYTSITHPPATGQALYSTLTKP